jgi:ABC-type multidrug transport system fused ATPase/permease subunit
VKRDAFWYFVRSMFRYWGLMLAALVLVCVSGAGLGLGLLGASPVLENLLAGTNNLPGLAAQWNARLAAGASALPALAGLAAGLAVPAATIAALPTAPFTALAAILGALALVTVVGSAAGFLHTSITLAVVNRTVTAARRRAFAAALRAPLGRILQEGPADVVARIVNDSAQLATGLNVLTSKAVLQFVKGAAALAVALAINAKLTALALLVAPALFVAIRSVGRRIKHGSARALQSQSGLYGAAAASLGALRTVKVNTAEAAEIARFHRINKSMLRELDRVRRAQALASPLTETINIVLLCGMVLVAGYAVSRGRITGHEVIMVLAVLAVAGSAFKPLTGIVNDVQAAAPAADRLKSIIDLAPEPGAARRLPRLARHARDIEFRGVTFTYPGAVSPALRGVSLTIPHGRRVAFVGPNGCGKTTLLSLLPRLFDPDAGAVLIDGTDVAGVSSRSLRAQMGVVTQESVLFKGSIGENIAFGHPGTTAERIVAAATSARAHEFIARLPGGYDAPVAEGGTSLSGGERQRLVLARAILRDPAILILDEATSMVDAAGEATITEALRELSVGRTVLIVAHRLATVQSCDSIVVMQSGAIVDQGTHPELLARCPLYQELARHPFLDGGPGDQGG